MGGCTNCASKGGCSTRKGEERALLAQLLPELYPGRRWGELDDARRDGVEEREARRLAQQAAAHLQAPAWYRAGARNELCDYVWVLCVGRQPGLLSLREADGVRAADLDGEQVREKYLRLALSQLARVATVQEVTLELAPDGDGFALRELPSPGIYDPILLKRTQKLVELVVAADISFLDFGLIETAPKGFDGAGYDYGQAPTTVNYLFYPQPTRAVSTVLLARE